MSHTEGPWKLIDEDGVYIAGPLGFEGDPTNRRVIANLWEPGENIEWLGDEDFANYQLMAAAPGLLEAAQKIVALWQPGKYSQAKMDAAVEELRAAIAEAKAAKPD